MYRWNNDKELRNKSTSYATVIRIQMNLMIDSAVLIQFDLRRYEMPSRGKPITLSSA